MSDPETVIHICITCKPAGATGEPPGRALFDAVNGLLGQAPLEHVVARPVACLAVCKRPCTIALSSSGKWTYVVGDLTPQDHPAEIIQAAIRYGASADGIVPWRERPQAFRRGIIARVPPAGFRMEEMPPELT